MNKYGNFKKITKLELKMKCPGCEAEWLPNQPKCTRCGISFEEALKMGRTSSFITESAISPKAFKKEIRRLFGGGKLWGPGKNMYHYTRFKQDPEWEEGLPENLRYMPDYDLTQESLREGLHPSVDEFQGLFESEKSKGNYRGFEEPRPGHVYLHRRDDKKNREHWITDDDGKVVNTVAGVPPTFIIDSKKLNPGAMDSDEDSLRSTLKCPDCSHVMYDHDPIQGDSSDCSCSNCLTDPKRYKSAGEFGEAVADRGDVEQQVLENMHRYNSMAYRGSIPAEAIQLNPEALKHEQNRRETLRDLKANPEKIEGYRKKNPYTPTTHDIIGDAIDEAFDFTSDTPGQDDSEQAQRQVAASLNYFEKEAFYGIPKEDGGDSAKNDAKMEDCVKKVMAKGHDKESAIRICKTSLGFTKDSAADEEDIPDDAETICAHCGESLKMSEATAAHSADAKMAVPWVQPTGGRKWMVRNTTWAAPHVAPEHFKCNVEKIGLVEAYMSESTDEGRRKEIGDSLRNWYGPEGSFRDVQHPFAFKGEKGNWPYAAIEEGGRAYGKNRDNPVTLGEISDHQVDLMDKVRSQMLAERDAGDDPDEIVARHSFKQMGNDDLVKELRSSCSGKQGRRLRKGFVGEWKDALMARLSRKTAKDYSTETREEYSEKGGKGEHWALPDGSFPIKDCGDVKDAVHRIGSTNKDKDMVKRHILKRWKALKCGGKEPFSSEKEASVNETISESGPSPISFIEDHEARLAMGVNPATCEVCSAPMELHSKWELNKQSNEAYWQDASDTFEVIAKHLEEVHDTTGFGKYASTDDDLLVDYMNELHEKMHKDAQFVNTDLLDLDNHPVEGTVGTWNDFQSSGEPNINTWASDRVAEDHERAEKARVKGEFANDDKFELKDHEFDADGKIDIENTVGLEEK